MNLRTLRLTSKIASEVDVNLCILTGKIASILICACELDVNLRILICALIEQLGKSKRYFWLM
jgi:hypothetical protein